MSSEIQRQSTSFAHRISSDREEWRDAVDYDYDDGRPSAVDFAQEQAEDEFWDEKESDYPRGYGPPQTGDEEHDHPGWLYVDDEAPIPDEVTDADVEDLADEDDFDPYADEFVDDGPLPFGTPIYNPGGGYDDYDHGLNDFEAEHDSDGPDIEKFSAATDCDHCYWGGECQECGAEDPSPERDHKVNTTPHGRMHREPWEKDDSHHTSRKTGGANPFDRRVAWGNTTSPPPRDPKPPQKAVRNDDVKIMRDSETGLGYDVIVKPSPDGNGYDVVKVLGALKNSAKAGDTFQHKHFRENVPGVKIKDQPFMQMKITRTDPNTVWYSAADGKGSWRMDRTQFEQDYG